MNGDGTKMKEGAGLGVAFQVSEIPGWYCITEVSERYVADDPVTGNKAGAIVDHEPAVGNLLMNGGASVLFQRLITKNPTTATGGVLAGYSTDNAMLAVSTDNTAAAVTQNTLIATTNHYGSMEAGYPSHTDGTASTTSREVQFRMIATTSEANNAWNSWGVFNGSSAGSRMLNRKVQSLGTKTSAAQWTLTVTLGLS